MKSMTVREWSKWLQSGNHLSVSRSNPSNSMKRGLYIFVCRGIMLHFSNENMYTYINRTPPATAPCFNSKTTKKAANFAVLTAGESHPKCHRSLTLKRMPTRVCYATYVPNPGSCITTISARNTISWQYYSQLVILLFLKPLLFT